MKQIEISTSTLEPAPIDGKNVMEESVIDDIFDQADHLANGVGDYVGFIMSEPAYAVIIDNRVKVFFISCSKPFRVLVDNIIKRLTGHNPGYIMPDDSRQYINEDEVHPLVYSFSWSRNTRSLSLRLHYAPEDYKS